MSYYDKSPMYNPNNISRSPKRIQKAASPEDAHRALTSWGRTYEMAEFLREIEEDRLWHTFYGGRRRNTT